MNLGNPVSEHFIPLLLLIIAVFSACSRGAEVPGHPRSVLGVKLGGSIEELKAVYRENDLLLRRTADDRYVSTETVELPAGLSASGVSYRLSSGILRVVEVDFEKDVSDELQAFIDEEYSIDPGLRQQQEQKQRFIGTIGEKDHFWLLPDMGVMVIIRGNETRLIYSLK